MDALKDTNICKNFFAKADEYTYSVQKSINESLGIGINASKPALKTTLIDKDTIATGNYDYDLNKYANAVELSANKRVDTIQQENARFQSDAGFGVTVSRTYDRVGLSDGRTCKWCLERVGSNIPYKQAVAKGMFQRHEGCHCVIEYNNNGEKTRQYTKGKNNWYQEGSTSDSEKLNEFRTKRRIAKAKGELYDATDEWLYNPNGKQGKTYTSDSVIVKGKKYVTDGVNVLQDHDKTKKKIANMIAEKTGKAVTLLPRVINPANIKCADYLIDEDKWDLKTVEGSSKNVIYNNIHNKKEQAENFIINIEKKTVSLSEATNQVVNGVFGSKHTSFVKKIMIVNEKEILKVLEK